MRARAAVSFAAQLTFENVSRAYGRHMAVDDVSLDIAPGEIVCLLGPSGCGKTTLLRIASGVEQPTAGRVLLNRLEVAGPQRFVAPDKRNVGLMFQDFALFPHLSVLDNVAFGLSGLPRATAEQAAMALLARVGLEAYAKAFPDTLSGGQQQRIALARAIAPRPAVVLMDEPFSGLDVLLRESMQQETLALLKETRSTAMIVTHSPAEALQLGDRIAVMRAGRLIQLGTAEELYRAPADLFVARLFSEINEIDVAAAGGEIDTPFGPIPAPGLRHGERATLCIRRRAIRFAEAGKGVPGRVLGVKFQGDLALLDIAVAGFDQPLRTLVREWEEPSPGSEVTLSIDPSGVLIFPSDVDRH